MADNDNFDLGRREALEAQIRKVSVPLAAAARWMKFLPTPVTSRRFVVPVGSCTVM